MLVPCLRSTAIYHFVSQNYGFLAIYKARAGERLNIVRCPPAPPRLSVMSIMLYTGTQ